MVEQGLVVGALDALGAAVDAAAEERVVRELED